MSCALTTNRTEPCKDKVGGIQKVWFVDYNTAADFVSISVTAGAVTTTDPDPLVGKYYEVRMASSLTQTITSSRENGTTMYAQTISLQLKGLSASDNVEIEALSHGRWVAIVVDNNGAGWIVGRNFGADVTTGTAQTGAAMGDLYGFNITIEAQEKELAPYTSDADALFV